MTKLLYFAWLREKTGIGRGADRPSRRCADDCRSDRLAKDRGPEFAAAFERDEVIRAAIDQEHVAQDAPVHGAREIAFFPPVTGG